MSLTESLKTRDREGAAILKQEQKAQECARIEKEMIEKKILKSTRLPEGKTLSDYISNDILFRVLAFFIGDLNFSTKNFFSIVLVCKQWRYLLKECVLKINLKKMVPYGVSNIFVHRVIKLLPELVWIDASNILLSDSFDPSTLMAFSNLKKLHYLNLSNTFVSASTELAPLVALPSLRTLIMRNILLNKLACLYISRIKSLVDLDISNSGIMDDDLAHLSNLELNYLSVEGCFVSMKGIHIIAKIKSLTQLNCFAIHGIHPFELAKTIPGLTHYIVDDIEYRLKDTNWKTYTLYNTKGVNWNWAPLGLQPNYFYSTWK